MVYRLKEDPDSLILAGPDYYVRWGAEVKGYSESKGATILAKPPAMTRLIRGDGSYRQINLHVGIMYSVARYYKKKGMHQFDDL